MLFRSKVVINAASLAVEFSDCHMEEGRIKPSSVVGRVDRGELARLLAKNTVQVFDDVLCRNEVTVRVDEESRAFNGFYIRSIDALSTHNWRNGCFDTFNRSDKCTGQWRHARLHNRTAPASEQYEEKKGAESRDAVSHGSIPSNGSFYGNCEVTKRRGVIYYRCDH